MKSHEQKEKEPIPASLPVRECGLKCKVHCEINHWTQVTPRAGVWIEIEKQQNENVAEVVTPRAGVWIEIELFFRINNGKLLTSIELTRVKAKCLKQFQEIATHSLISESVTEAGKKRYTDENIAMQAWMLCFSEVKDFSTKAFRPCIETANVTEEHLQKIKDAMDSVKDVCSSLDPENKADKRVLKKIRTRSHLVSSIYLAMRFIEEGRKQEEFMEALYKFFDCAKTSVSEAYNNSVGGSSARPEKIRERMAALDALLWKREEDENGRRD